MRYRPEIDGLRALAVVPVVLFHAGFTSFSGGFVGVDVFFVISGYLISTIIYNDIDAGRFSIGRFYERRIRRIFPALMLVATCTVFFAYVLMFPAEMAEFSHSLISVNLFVSNILFWNQSGYFESAAELKPLLHTWSLSVEEQFYIFFPLLIFALRRKSSKFIFLVILCLSTLSLGLAEVASRTSPDANFFLLPTRAWELGVGALVAIRSSSCVNLGKTACQLLSALGFFMIGLAIVAFDGSVRFPSLWGLLPVAGTALVILATTPDTIVGRMLTLRPIVALGLMSYSIYLWHQPIFAFYRMYHIGDPPLRGYLPLIAMTVILAYLTWRYVEQPFRKGVFQTRRRLFGAAAGVSVALILVGLVSAVPTATGVAREGLAKNCIWKSDLDSACGSPETAAGTVVLWGDSFADAIAVSLLDDMKTNGIPFVPLIAHSCPSLLNTRRNEDYRLGSGFSARCQTHNQDVAEMLAALKPSVVILANHYVAYSEYTNPYDGRPILVSDAYNGESGTDIVADSLAETTRFLESIGAKAIILTPHPILDAFQNRRRRYEKLGGDAEVFALDRTAVDDLRETLVRAVPSAIAVDVTDLLCGGGSCSALRSDGELLLFDGGHVSTAFSPVVADAITSEVISVLGKGDGVPSRISARATPSPIAPAAGPVQGSSAALK